MVGVLGVLALVFVVHAVSPRLGEALAWMIVVGFLFPLLTFGGGLVAWFFTCLFSKGSNWDVGTYATCCLCFGLPLGLIIAWFVLKTEK